MRQNTRTWLFIGIGLLVMLVFVNALVTYQRTQELHEGSFWVTHSHQVLAELERLISTVKDAETGQRGYLLTDDESYLEPYKEAIASERGILDKLGTLTEDNAAQRQRMPRLKELVAARLARLDKGVDFIKAGNSEAAREFILSGEGKRLMNELRALVDEMETTERNLLATRQTIHDRAYRSANLHVLLAATVALVALAAFLALLHRHLTTSERNEADIHQQRELLRATLTSIGDAVIATDQTGRITFLNSVAEKLTGWTQDEAVGRPLEQVFLIVNEETRKGTENPATRAMREGRIVGLANHTLLIAKDGTEWPIDDSAAPIAAAGGKVSGAILVFHEITQRKRHEQELLAQTEALQEASQRKDELLWDLQASEEQFHTLADSIPQLAWIATPDGSIVWYNKRWYEYTGLTKEQTEGWKWQSVHDPAELPRVLEGWKKSLAAGEPWDDTFPLRRHDGAMRWHLSRAVPVKDERGKIVRWFGTNTDISEQQDMQQALKDADRRKDEFLATLAHELRNPLAPISNALCLWPMVENDRAEMERLREMMDRQLRQMTRLIDDLMDVSRISRGRIQLQKQRVDIGTVLQGAVESVQPMIDARNHQLSVSIPTEPIYLDGDVARLTQVFGNVLNNAAKYTSRDGVIWVAAHRHDSKVVISIRDNGPGIPRHMLSQIFEMFEQVDHTMQRSFGGLGIGLTLVKRLVELHGGSVEARSEGPGKGSEFIVTLPAADASQPTAARRHSLSQLAGIPRRRVLVVDDVHASAATLAMMLENIGQEVTTANDGMTALAKAKEKHPDLVLLDIAMPGMDGYEVARRLRGEEDCSELTLVALTGYGQEEDRRRAIQAGFDHHMVKPASMEQLIQLLIAAPPRRGDGRTTLSNP